VAGALSEAEYAERLYQAMAAEAADELAASEQRAAKRALRKAELKVPPGAPCGAARGRCVAAGRKQAAPAGAGARHPPSPPPTPAPPPGLSYRARLVCGLRVGLRPHVVRAGGASRAVPRAQARAARKRRDLQRQVLYTLPVTPRAGEEARSAAARPGVT